MTTSSRALPELQPRDASFWASQSTLLEVGKMPTGALNLNVQGRQALGPLQGFGQMWQKTYRVRLEGVSVTPAEVIKTWKANFSTFWPQGNRFYSPLIGIVPGEVALLNLAIPGGISLSTGVLVLYADDESFTLMTPQGHMFAGWITFSAYEEDNAVIVQAQVLMRADDLLYEIGLRLGGHRTEDVFWQHTLTAVARHFAVEQPYVQTESICLDPTLQWSRFWNIWQNAALRTMLYRAATPGRVIRGLLKRRY